MKKLLVRFVREEEGQDLIEYGLLAGFISLACVGAVTAVGEALDVLYTDIETEITNAS